MATNQLVDGIFNDVVDVAAQYFHYLYSINLAIRKAICPSAAVTEACGPQMTKLCCWWLRFSIPNYAKHFDSVLVFLYNFDLVRGVLLTLLDCQLYLFTLH